MIKRKVSSDMTSDHNMKTSIKENVSSVTKNVFSNKRQAFSLHVVHLSSNEALNISHKIITPKS